MTRKSFVFVVAMILPLLLTPGGSHAASSGGDKSSSANAPLSEDYSAGKTAAKDGDFEAAAGFFAKAVDADPTDADALNMLGFSHRKLGNFDLALENYNAALKIDPNHLGANEYIGELYLELGDLAKAEKHLNTLDDACFFGCEAYTDLKAAIKRYKANQGG